MGDGFEYRLTSLNVLPFNAPTGADLPWGFRWMPSLRLSLSDFFAEVRVEGGAARAAATPIGDNYFETTPSSTLSAQAFGCWVYTPSDAHDTQRGNFCVRALNLGYRIGSDFQVRFGRSRYEVTEYEQMFMANAYAATPHFANLYIPYGWLGGELRFDQRRETETVRRLMFSAAMMDGADGGFLGIAQFYLGLGFGQGPHSTRLSLTAYAGLRSNPHSTDPDVVDTGMAHGEGAGFQFDYDFFSAGLGVAHQFSSWRNRAGLEPFQERGEGTFFLDFHPGSFRFRGSISDLFRADFQGRYAFDPPSGQSEFKTEWLVGYHPVTGVLISLGYIGAFGAHLSENIVFLGVQTTYSNTIPFGR
jgi:hypothetical protein